MQPLLTDAIPEEGSDAEDSPRAERASQDSSKSSQSQAQPHPTLAE